MNNGGSALDVELNHVGCQYVEYVGKKENIKGWVTASVW